MKEHKWKMLMPWFKAHKIEKMDPSYVQSVSFAQNANCFVSAASNGEVKLWMNDLKLTPLGILNSQSW